MTEPHLIDGGIHCIRCGYDLRGTDANGQCPECGGNVIESLAAARSITKREVAVLACRILALWLGVYGLLGFVGSIMYFIFESIGFQDIFLYYFAAQEGLSVTGAVLLWCFSTRISQWMIHIDGPALPSQQWELGDLMQVAVCILGLVLLIEGGVELMSFLVMVALDGNGGFSWLEFYEDTDPIASACYIICGFMLIKSRGRFAYWVHRARTVGTPQ